MLFFLNLIYVVISYLLTDKGLRVIIESEMGFLGSSLAKIMPFAIVLILFYLLFADLHW